MADPSTLFLPTDATVVMPNGMISPVWWRYFKDLTIGLTTIDLTSQVTGILPIGNGGTGNTTGSATSASKLVPGRTINGVAFDGTTNITITASDTTLVKYPSLDSYGIGASVLSSITTGSNNFATNASALTSLTSGKNNIAMGNGAMFHTTTADDNVAVGVNALGSNTTGHDNVSIGGSDAMFGNITGYVNVALGPEALYGGISANQIADGTFPTPNSARWTIGTGWDLSVAGKAQKNANGTGTLSATLSGSPYIDYGVGATYTITYTVSDYSVGAVTLSFANVSDTARSANGTYVFSAVPTTYTGNGTLVFTPTGGSANTSRFSISNVSLVMTNTGQGYENVAIAQGALYQNNTGYHNIAVGVGSGRQHTTGAENVFVGVESGAFNGSGNQNVSVGKRALYSGNTGSGCVAIGYQAGYYETGNNKLFIDNQLRASESDARVKALVYGVFDALVANQSFTVNGTIMGAGYKSSDGSAGTSGTATGANTLTIKNGLVTVIA